MSWSIRAISSSRLLVPLWRYRPPGCSPGRCADPPPRDSWPGGPLRTSAGIVIAQQSPGSLRITLAAGGRQGGRTGPIALEQGCGPAGYRRSMDRISVPTAMFPRRVDEHCHLVPPAASRAAWMSMGAVMSRQPHHRRMSALSLSHSSPLRCTSTTCFPSVRYRLQRAQILRRQGSAVPARPGWGFLPSLARHSSGFIMEFWMAFFIYAEPGRRGRPGAAPPRSHGCTPRRPGPCGVGSL